MSAQLPFVHDHPLIVEVRRGGAVESTHLVDVAVVDCDGCVILGYGDTERPVFPRSAMKPLQSLALVEQLQTAGLDGSFCAETLCVTCASHNGQPAHIQAASALLRQFDIAEDHLICGAHWSLDQDSLIDQVRAAAAPTRLHNNCSGKHAGMLVLAHLMQAPFAGYHQPDHPVQQRILGCLEAMTGCDLTVYGTAVDGCGAPALAGPLGNWARGFALFTGDGALPEARQTACRTLTMAIADAPHMIAGDRRLCSTVNQAFGPAVTAKVGAEGVYAAAFHDLGLGLMLKARDGAKRAAEQALLHVLQVMGFALPVPVTAAFQPELTNWAGAAVGDIKVRPPGQTS